jgi:hypothetical protein
MRYARSANVVVRALRPGEGAVALHLETGAYHGLNDVGSLVWELLATPSTAAEIVQHVRERIPDAPPQIEDDVSVFLEQLASRGLIEESSRP